MVTNRSVSPPESDSRPFRIPALGMAVLLALAGSGCNDGTAPATPSGEAIAILNPKPGASINMEDTLRIVSESDYTRFGGSLSFAFSDDSGKSWILIESLPRVKSGAKVLDTLPWVPADFGIAPGPILLMVQEYDKDHKATIGLTLTGTMESGTGRPE